MMRKTPAAPSLSSGNNALADLLKLSTVELAERGIEEADTDARLLLQYVTGLSRTELYLHGKDFLPEEQLVHFKALLARRKRREPVAYILGEQEFWSLLFKVSPDVLIPRPETEFLLETVLGRCTKDNFSRGRILDLCCGSGAIAVVLARELEKSVSAVDISGDALEIARQNSVRHGVDRLINFVCGDLFSPFAPQNLFSVVVSNPPYISNTDVHGVLQPEVCEHEPHLALDGGDMGMEVISRIYSQLREHLMAGGEFFMEFGAEQGKMIYDLFAAVSSDGKLFGQVEILQDYAGRDRVLHAVRNL